MAYTKNPTWVDGAAGGTLIDAADLNHMEDGIQAAAATADAAIPAAQKGAASGVASLDATGKVPAAQIPATADATTTSKGIVQLAGDLAGTAASPTVPGLTSRIPTSTVTTKGDLIVGTAASTVSRQGAGADGTVLTADSTQATGVRWAAASGASVKNWAPGAYGLPGCTIIGGGAGAMGALTANTTYFAPFRLDASGTCTALTISVNTAAAAGGLARLGIFSINASGMEAAHTLVLDAGTVATDSTGTKEIVVSQALSAGWYALGVMTNAGTPTLYCLNVGTNLFGGAHRLSNDGFMTKRSLSVATTFGAYPSTLTPAFSVGWDPISGNTAVGLVKLT